MNNDLISRSALLELRCTEHSYYCSESNYYVDGYNNFGRYECADWHDFKVDWLDGESLNLDDDYNHLFRFDILEDEDNPGNFRLLLFFILQRKGIFRPVVIHRITQEDMPEIEEFLSQRWQYMKSQWCEFSEETAQRGLSIMLTSAQSAAETNKLKLDAAIADMKAIAENTGCCHCCAHQPDMNPDGSCDRFDPQNPGECWEWRGTHEKDNTLRADRADRTGTV